MANGAQTDRVRSVVLLVITTIALPSLLLTGLGLAAIENEEAASRRRLEQAYMPVLSKTAKVFNERVARLLEEANGPLGDLVEWAQNERTDVELDRFLAYSSDAPFAINFFVIGPSADQLVPPVGSHCSEGWLKLIDGHESSCSKNASCACEEYLEIADDHRVGKDNRCAAQFAARLCLSRQNGQAVELPDCIDGSEFGKAALELASQADDVDGKVSWIGRVQELTEELRDPRAALPEQVAKVIAWWFVPRLETDSTAEAVAAAGTLRAVASRGQLLEHLRTLNRSRDGEARVSSWSIGGWRRVVITQSVDDHTVGFELSPERMQLHLRGAVESMGLDPSVAVWLVPIEVPKARALAFKERFGDRTASWALLKQTELAWEMIVVLHDDGRLFDLVQSRSRLYLWALGVIVLALLVGIGYTLRAVLREARESRLKTDFVSSISHDLRTPLTSIRMFTESLLMGRVASNEEMRDSLEVIALETERLSRLTERILDFSRMESGRKAYGFQPTRIEEIVDHAVTACAPMLDAGPFDVEVSIAEDLPTVDADRDALIEALINLLTNAIKYSPDEKRIFVRVERDGESVRVAVSDRGMGIPRAEHDRIFEKFHRVDCRRASEVGGCGLGLALVRHIVDAHGGNMEVDSAPKRGSTFTIVLPDARPT